MQLNKKINFTEKGLLFCKKRIDKVYIYKYLYILLFISFHNNRKKIFIKKIMTYTNTLYNRIYCIYMWYLYNINKEVKLIEKNLLLRNFTLFDIIGGPTIQDPFLLHHSDILSQNSSFRQLNVDIFAIHVQANICPAISSRF